MCDILTKNPGFVKHQNWQQKERMFNCIKGFFLKHEVPMDVAGSVYTDRAPVMLGKNSGCFLCEEWNTRRFGLPFYATPTCTYDKHFAREFEKYFV